MDTSKTGQWLSKWSSGRPCTDSHEATVAQNNSGSCQVCGTFLHFWLHPLGEDLDVNSRLYACVSVTWSASKILPRLSILMLSFTPHCKALKQEDHPGFKDVQLVHLDGQVSNLGVWIASLVFYLHFGTTASGQANSTIGQKMPVALSLSELHHDRVERIQKMLEIFGKAFPSSNTEGSELRLWGSGQLGSNPNLTTY